MTRPLIYFNTVVTVLARSWLIWQFTNNIELAEQLAHSIAMHDAYTVSIEAYMG